MTTTFTPNAIIEATADGYTVWVHWTSPPVDRPCSHGFAVRKLPLAQRLARAIRAGVVERKPEVLTDIKGETYVGSTSTVLGRTLNADLRRLGF